jgi:hypothetical protein
VDWERFLVEVRRQIEADTLPELLTPGLLAVDDGAEVVVFEKREPGHDPDHVDLANLGSEVARIPWYRLRHPDPERLRKVAHIALEQFPIHVADQLATAINAGEMDVHSPAEDDWIRVHVRLGDDVVKLLAAHRCTVVPGWPLDPPTPGGYDAE